MRGNVDTIKERLDITEVISGYTKLEKAGTNFKARCPFHNEKTPSFFVSPSRQGYYCFGCGAKGDMFTFVQEMEGIDFRGALKLLAEKAGVEIEFRSPEAKTEKNRIENALESATNFFVDELFSNQTALRYLKGRGMNDASIKYWRLGYAPDDWRRLYHHLTQLGFDKNILLKAGLVKNSEDEKREPYDIFRRRIIFPISDYTGRVVAFSGRIFPEGEKEGDFGPKYLNTPDTALFNKSETLYGLDRAKEEIRKKNFSILVEGQMDLVLSHEAGVRNVVAASGTAFTSLHLERLKRLSQRILLAFDADPAGEKASERSARLGLSLGMEVKIARIPRGKDPAELVKENPELWKNSLREAQPAVEFFLSNIISEEKDSQKRVRLVGKKVLPLIALTSSALERSHFVSLLAKKMSIREEIIWEDLRKINLQEVIGNQEDSVEIKRDKKIFPRRTYIERRLIGIIFWQESLDQPNIDISSLKAEISLRAGEEYFKNLLDSLAIERESLIFEAENYFSSLDRLAKDITELLENLSGDLLRERLAELLSKLSQAELSHDEAKTEELSLEIKKVHGEMLALEKIAEKI